MPKKFEEYFESKSVVGLLARKRVSAARLSRKESFFHGVCGTDVKPRADDIRELENLHYLLPARKHWPRPPKHHRHDPTSDGPTAQARALAQYVGRQVTRPPADSDYRWLKNLRKFIRNIQDRSYNWRSADTYESRNIRVTPKKGRSFEKGCRILAVYGLEDTILASCFSAYLREQINENLDPGCLAFRPATAGHIPTHHDAIERIYDFRTSIADGQPIYVSECDIQGFFDSVSHDVILEELRGLCSLSNLQLDDRLWQFLASFLCGYSYSQYALCNGAYKLASIGILKPKIFDPKDALRKLNVPPDRFHGIPQGSAMSCILANIVLASADLRVRQTLAGDTLGKHLYLRYCDDIVIISTDKTRCSAAIAAYTSQLSVLKLPFHPLKHTRFYDSEFWTKKSKETYLWQDGGKSSSPWLSFVGYQIHRDGRIRIRKGSIEKEIQKQKDAASEIIKRLNKRIFIETHALVPRGIVYRLRLHLASFGVGTPSGTILGPTPNGKSWVAGFIALKGRRIDFNGLRRLDRARSSAIRRVRIHLSTLYHNDRISFPVSANQDKSHLQYIGRPFSYAYHASKPLPTLAANLRPIDETIGPVSKPRYLSSPGPDDVSHSPPKQL